MNRFLLLATCLWVSAAWAQTPVGKPAEKKPEKEVEAKPARDRKLLLTTMISALKDEDENIRAKAAEDIGKLQPPAVESVSALIAALKDPASVVRWRAAETLEKIGTPKARKAVMKFRRQLGRQKTW